MISGVLGDFPLTRGYLDGDVTNAYLAVDPLGLRWIMMISIKIPSRSKAAWISR